MTTTIAREAVLAVLAVVRADDQVRNELRELLGVGVAPVREVVLVVLYMRVAAYAKRIAFSERKTWSLVSEGLPTIGNGRSRRVDVARADEWLRDRAATTNDDVIEKRARSDARRSMRGSR